MGYGAVRDQRRQRTQVIFEGSGITSASIPPLGLDEKKKYIITVNGVRHRSSLEYMVSSVDLGFGPSGVLGQIGVSTEGVYYEATFKNLLSLGLTLEEYSAFFPGDLNLDACPYLTNEYRQTIASIPEADRRGHRGQAIAKLDVTQQFLWETSGYEDRLKIEIMDWGISDATEELPPRISCNALITWIGPTTGTVSAPSTARFTVSVPAAGLSKRVTAYYPKDARAPAIPPSYVYVPAISGGGVTVYESGNACIIESSSQGPVKIEVIL